ncbi:MAG: cytochrome c [Proteobacteria bacterium]|nr:cytochrome c [Pseudomonadota bacterium]
MKKMLYIASLLGAGLMTSLHAVAGVDAARQNELLYFIKHDCGSCHGMTLKGGLGPALLPETLAAKPRDYLVNTILLGRENTAMPPWNTMLSRDDAEWITEQLQDGKVMETELVLNKKSQDLSGTGK